MNSLYKILSMGAMALGLIGCQDRYNADVDLDFEDTLSVKVEQPQLLQDIDGDNKLDLVYVIQENFREFCEWKDYKGEKWWSNSGAYSYELVWRKNLGEGRFDSPKQIMKTRTRPDGFQILFEKGEQGYKKKCKKVKDESLKGT